MNKVKGVQKIFFIDNNLIIQYPEMSFDYEQFVLMLIDNWIDIEMN